MTEADNTQSNVQLQISFPKSNEDRRLRLININGSIFALIYCPLDSLGPIRLNCEDWSLILLAPVKSKTNILISAINIICLSEIVSEEGNVNVHASNRLIKFASLNGVPEKLCEMGENGEYSLDDDPGAFLHYYQLFDSIADKISDATPDSFSEAQQKFITALCSLAGKIEGNSEELTLRKVLDIWNI